MTSRRSILRLAAAFAALSATAAPSFAQQAMNLYTTREPGLVRPLLEAFTAQTGIKVNTVFVKEGLAERVAAEGARSPADVLMDVDVGAILDLVDKGVTQPVRSEVLEQAVPAQPARCEGPLVRALDARAARLRLQGSSGVTLDQLRGSRRPEVQGQGLHPLGPAPLQHGADRGLHQPSRRPRRPRPGCAASRPISPAVRPAATARSRATFSRASARSASATPTTSA